MGKSENKTKPTAQLVNDFIAAIDDPAKRVDCEKLLEIMTRISGYSPMMWGNIVGFGEYHYVYDSGREGDFFRVGFSPRAQNLTIYIMPGYQDFSEELLRLGKHKMGKSCLYIKTLSHVDIDVLEDIVMKGLKLMGKSYPDKIWS